jgi:hypothetical protein
LPTEEKKSREKRDHTTITIIATNIARMAKKKRMERNRVTRMTLPIRGVPTK